MPLTIAEFAAKRGVSVQRARQLARSGAVPARMVAGRWLIESVTPPRARRPLAPQTQQDLLKYFRTRNLDHVKEMRKQRLAKVIAQLTSSDNPAALLRDYFANTVDELHPVDGALVLAARKHQDAEVKLALQYRRSIHISDRRSFGQRLSDHRILNQQTAQELSASSGMSLPTIRQIERGTYPLTQIGARKLAHAAGLRVARMEIREQHV